jgi:dihydropteroate synthase
LESFARKKYSQSTLASTNLLQVLVLHLMLYEQTTLNCKGHLLDLTEPIVMGILNVTPDSFYKGSRIKTKNALLKQTERMLTEGAEIVDIGGMSSRPGAEIITEKEELSRVLPAIKAVLKEFPEALISIDTIRASVAQASIDEGARLINDITAGRFDAKMFETIAAMKNVPYILMHMKGDSPATMQRDAHYDNIALEILDFFIEKIGILRGLGVKDIILDVGFGFGKTVDHNFTLLQKLHVFKILEIPILAGLSRKGMIWKTLNITADDALNGTTVLNTIALQQGAKILRVHDVKAAVETIQLFLKLQETDK